MKIKIPKWRIEKVEVRRNDVLDEEYSGYELQKNGVMVCKFSLDSLEELKDFFGELILPK